VVDDYLNDYCKQKLSQTGMFVTINGQRIILCNTSEKARKKTCNKWFETQDSISYWEDFSKPKILWKRVGSILRFCYNSNHFLGLDSTCFATGDNIEFICCVLNSHMGHYLLKDAPKTGTGDLLISVQAVEPIRIPLIEKSFNTYFSKAVIELANKNNHEIETDINRKVFDLYNLTKNEIKYITDNFT
jgi:hypothetical protein